MLRQLVEVHHADIGALRADGDGLGFSLLHMACRLDRTELVQLLVSAPTINVNLACGDEGLRMMPLHVACVAGPVSAVRQLLALPQIQVNATTSQGSSSLFLACTWQKAEVVEELLRHPDIDVNFSPAPVENSLPPLALAAYMGYSAIAGLLLQHPAINVNAAGREGWMNPLCMASYEGHADVVRQLLRHPDIQVNAAAGLSSLGIACAKEHLPVIQELLLHSGLEEGTIRTALAEAGARGQTAVVALLKGSRAVRRALRGQGGA